MTDKDMIVELSGRVRAIDIFIIEAELLLRQSNGRDKKDEVRKDIKMFKQEQQKYLNRIHKLHAKEVE